MARDGLVLPLAQSQYGLMSRQQALRAGMGESSIDWRVRSGDWEPAACGVYRLPGAPASWHQRALAVCLQAGPHAALSHRSAAYVWRLDTVGRGAPEPIEVVIPRGHELKAAATVRATRRFERGLYRGMPVTPLSRTLIDLASVLSETELEVAFDSAMRFGRRALKGLEAKLAQLPARGRHGIQVLRELKEAYDGTLDSALEVLVRKLLWAAGLPKPRVHFDVWQARRWIANVDFAWPAQKLVVQAHGLKWHLNPRRYRIDLRQQSELFLAGWLPVVTTWKEVNERPADFIEHLQAAWARLSGISGAPPGIPGQKVNAAGDTNQPGT